MQNQENSDMSNGLYHQSVPDYDLYYLSDYLSYDDIDNSQHIHFATQNSLDHNLTPESSSTRGDYHSPSTISFSPNGSPQQDSQVYPSDQRNSSDNTYGSPISSSSITNEVIDLAHKMKELETVILDDSDIAESSVYSNIQAEENQSSFEQKRSKQMVEVIEKKDLKQALILCAEAISENDISRTDWLMSELRQMVSVSGEPIQRLGAYILEGLVARLASSGSSIYKALRCKEPASSDLLSYMHILYEACPYFKFGYISANGAIVEALKDENRIHIIDFQISQGSQWVTFLQAMAGRPGGPPHVRITGIDDSVSAYARNGGLQIVGQRLSRFAESCKVPFEFNIGALSANQVELQNLEIRRGEALAVNFTMMLHHMPDESVGTHNHRDRLLRLVKSLSPKVVTLVEQESNTNTAPFVHRVIETLSYYAAVFESLDEAYPREHKERINVEQHCLARDVVNIIACEGGERIERHEPLGKWRSRFMMAGFTPYPLNSVVNDAIKNLLEENYSSKYRLEEREGALYLGWMNKALVASCAWK